MSEFSFLKDHPSEIRENTCWKRKKKSGAEKRKSAISNQEIKIPGRQKADGIEQVNILKQKKHHSQTPLLGTIPARDVLKNIQPYSLNNKKKKKEQQLARGQ